LIVTLLFIANTINIGADLSSMADAARVLFGGRSLLYVLAFTAICVGGIVFIQYKLYVTFLKWLTLSLFAYVAAMFAAKVNWSDALSGVLLPRITWSNEYFTTLVVILGTTISPYLFFWQASQDAEDVHVDRRRKTLLKAPRQELDAFARIRTDTLLGMAFCNAIALAIIITTAATLHRAGVTNIETSTQAAEALKPIAGAFTFTVFAVGIIGTGLLAIPVLAASAAYAVGEGRRWPVVRRPGSRRASRRPTRRSVRQSRCADEPARESTPDPCRGQHNFYVLAPGGFGRCVSDPMAVRSFELLIFRDPAQCLSVMFVRTRASLHSLRLS